jgi:hypothetical protein
MGTLMYNPAILSDPSVEMFDMALVRGRSHKFINMLTHHSACLLDLGNYQSPLNNGHYAGLQEVALDDIRGTEGRQNDFDDRFNPITDTMRQRWQNVARAFDTGIDLPPVDLIQVGKVYFVRDGHHRVSVARARGQTSITAIVTVW